VNLFSGKRFARHLPSPLSSFLKIPVPLTSSLSVH
jgi:hypothetical protein